MEDNVALDSSKQKKFVKSIKKLIKKGGEVSKENDAPKASDEVKKSKRKRPDRGLVYLSHIPHGFYEHEMTQYFKQFGMVTNVRVIRSKRTGNSKGYAFVEFKEPSVAEIVAETMNNYLMGKRIIKAAVIPPEKQKPKAMRKHWNRVHNPGAEARLKMKKAYNADKDENGELKKARRIISNLNKTKSKLTEIGINYDFFTPVDIPGALQPLLEIQSNKQEDKQKNNKKSQELQTDTKSSKKNKEKTKIEVIKADTKISDIKVDQKAAKKLDKVDQKALKKLDKKAPTKLEKADQKALKKLEKADQEAPNKLDKTLQKSKEEKLKAAGVKSADNFIKIQQESQDSDSSLGFDSDEYEKMLDNDDSDMSDEDGEGSSEEDVSGDDNNDEEEDDAGEEEEDSEELDDESEEEAPPPKKGKGKKRPILPQPPKENKKGKQQPGKVPQVKESEVKRKFVQKHTTNSKKPKFEKQSQKPIKKQFKKK